MTKTLHSTAASQTAVAAAPTSVGNSGLSGQTISFNPTLVISSMVLRSIIQTLCLMEAILVEFANNGIEQVEGERLVISITV